MLHALSALVLAADAEAEPSKTPFYIFGGLLVLWAVTMSGIGMSQATFPATAAVKRGVIALTALLVIGAMATAIITA
jgi:hypothetical protein